MAPEVRRVYQGASKSYIPEKVDSFDLGMCLFALMFKKMPFAAAESSDPHYSLVSRGKFDDFFRRHDAVGKPLSGLELIWDCLNPNPAMRPSMRQIKKYTWYK